MDGNVRILPLVLVILVLGTSPWRAAGGEPTSPGEAFVARLVHPERQADEVLRLFRGVTVEGSGGRTRGVEDAEAGRGPGKAGGGGDCPVQRRDGPRVAFARRRRDPDRPGCRDREARLVRRHPSRRRYGGRRDHRDALTYPDDRPLAVDGREFAVARLGRSGVPLACLAGTGIVLASSRDRLERGVAGSRVGRDPGGDPDSGTVFRLDPTRLPNPSVGSLARSNDRDIAGVRMPRRRRGCLPEGRISRPGCLNDPGRRSAGGRSGSGPHGRNRVAEGFAMLTESWRWSPSSSIPPSWDFAFAAADRIEGVDPARSRLAPLRTRLNLLVMGAGLGLESDIRPHLRGVSACSFGEPDTPGRLAGGLIVLHLDEAAVARRLVRQAGPRLGGLAGGDATARAVTLRPRDRDVWIGWGEGAGVASREDRAGRGPFARGSLRGLGGRGAAAARPRRGPLAGSDLAACRDGGGGQRAWPMIRPSSGGARANRGASTTSCDGPGSVIACGASWRRGRATLGQGRDCGFRTENSRLRINDT